MRFWLPALAVLLVAIVAIAWWWSKPPAPNVENDDFNWPSGIGGPSRANSIDANTARVRAFGRVLDDKGAPIPGATVKLYARAFAFDDATCTECGTPIWNCGLPQTMQHVAEMLRAGTFPSPAVIAEQPVNADGTFVFENAPLEAVVLASADGFHGDFGAARDAEMRIELNRLRDLTWTFVGDDNQPRTDAHVTVFEPVLGTTREFTVDRDAKLTLRSEDPLAWAYVEAPGALPWGDRLIHDRQVHLGAPRTLVVKTLRDGAPVDADVEIEVAQHHFKQRSSRGVTRFEALPRLPIDITAIAGGLVSGSHHVMTEDVVTEVVVELFEAGTLTITLESPEGDPVNEGFVSLSSVVLDANKDIKPGALVIFDHIPAGDYEFSVETKAFVHEERQIEITGGRETRVAVTLRKPLLIAGAVLDAEGNPTEDHTLTVTDENGEDVDTRSREFGLKFEEEVPHEGKFVVHATSPLMGEGEAPATVPGPPVIVRLKSRGVLEVRVRSPEGEELSPSVTVMPPDGWRRLYLQPPLDGGWSRNASLATGDYELIGEPTGYLPFKRTVHVTEGKTTCVEVTADPGATISGHVTNEDGTPVSTLHVAIDGKDGYVSTSVEDDGTFELHGVTPGPVELMTCDSPKSPSKTFPLEAPARAVELRCPRTQLSHGRVINQRGEPVTRFHANDRDVSNADGRFEIAWTGELLIFADGYSTFSMSDAGVEVGDITLESEPMLEGDVVNTDGSPVSGASVRFSRHSDGARTDARGHFKLALHTVEEVEVLASLGKLSGSAKATAGTPVRIVIKPNVHMTGHIVDRQGKGVTATIVAESGGGRSEFRSDAQGNFAGDLSEGVWIFTSRLLDGMRAIEIAGPETHVELGRSAGTCGLTVEAPGQSLSVGWLLPSKPESLEDEPEPVANAFSAIARGNSLVFSGVPCGAYSVVVSFNKKPNAHGLDILDSLKPGYASELIKLRGDNERLVLPAP